jgi:hypothetical protein
MPKPTSRPPDPAGPESADRRKWLRYPSSELSANLILEPEESGWPAEPHDISRSGIRLVLTRRLEAGTEATAVIYHPGRQFFVRVPMRVAYVIAQPGDRFILGGTFVRELSDDELRGLL